MSDDAPMYPRAVVHLPVLTKDGRWITWPYEPFCESVKTDDGWTIRMGYRPLPVKYTAELAG